LISGNCRGCHLLARSPPNDRSSTAWAKRSVSIFPVTGSTSTKTGIPFSNKITLVEETKENGLVMTISPGLTLAARMHKCRPAVPELTPMACFAPVNAQKAPSKASIFGPILKLGVLTTSFTACRSVSVRSGDDIRIFIDPHNFTSLKVSRQLFYGEMPSSANHIITVNDGNAHK